MKVVKLLFDEKIIKSTDLKNKDYNISILAVIFGGNYLSESYKVQAPSLNKALKLVMQEVKKEYVKYFHIDIENIMTNCEMQTAILHATNIFGELTAVAEIDIKEFIYNDINRIIK